MSEKKTLRLTCPQWQGGLNPNYVFGSELLTFIAPPNKNDECVTIPTDRDFDKPYKTVDGIDFGDILLSQMQDTKKILEEKQPDKIIVFGGDCSVTQIPFDYLSGKYGDKIGILWLDAHPDISSPKTSSHLHEMPLSNLLGLNPDSAITKVENPFTPGKTFLAGLIEESLRPMDMACKELNLRIAAPEELERDSQAVMDWVRQENIQYLAVHWDLDVLSPTDFRCIYPAEPYTDVTAFPAAVGRMKLSSIGRLLNDVAVMADIVGLSITEHLPWDAFNMRKMLSDISIFKGH